MAGFISNSPGPSVTEPPRLLISVASALSRSVSCSRRCAIPLSVEGESAKQASAAIEGVVIENIETTKKTLPDFPGMWQGMLNG